MRRLGKIALAGLVTLAALAATSCNVTGRSASGELRVLAGSELADMQPILDQAAKDTGVRVKLSFTGTLDGVQQIVDGKADGHYDAIWFSSNRYLSLHREAQRRLGPSVNTMISPVILGVRASVAQRLGWDSRPVTWSNIAEAAGQRQFSHGMTNPAASNSGFSAVVGVTAALAASGSALDAGTVERVTPQLQRFFATQELTAGSSGWLSEAFLRRSASGVGQPVDGLINYESVLLSLNASGRLREPLTLIYPRDGVVSADYPLTMLASASDKARDNFRKLTDYLRRPDVQRQIMERTNRRPITPQVRLAGRFGGGEALSELPFPARLDAVDALIASHFDKIRRPARTVYVLDTSASMQGERIAGLKAALTALTGADSTLARRFARFHDREEVTFLPFSTTPHTPTGFTVSPESPDTTLGQIRSYAQSMGTKGNTAIYDSLELAYQRLAAAPRTDAFTSIVLMTDGESNRGADFAAFQKTSPPSKSGTPGSRTPCARSRCS